MTKDFETFARNLAEITQFNRLQIIHELRTCDQDELSVNTIVEKLGIRQNLISYHLNKLAELGILNRRVNGKQRMYSLNHEGLSDLATGVDTYL